MTTADSSTFSALAGIVANVEDFAACYRSEKLPLVRFLMNHGATQSEAHDAAQEAFTEAWRNWASIRAPRAWLRTVALREFYRGLPRREIPTESFRDILPARPPEADLNEQARDVLAALQQLPFRQRQVMALRIDGFSPAEIASQLGIDPAAARQSLAKAKKNLSELLHLTRRTAR